MTYIKSKGEQPCRIVPLFTLSSRSCWLWPAFASQNSQIGTSCNIALLLFKDGASTNLCFFRHWLHTVVFFTRKNFQDDSGLCTLSFSGFWSRPRLRVVGSCIRSVKATWPVGSITFAGLRNFYIPRNPGSHSWPSALRLIASPCFGLSN